MAGGLGDAVEMGGVRRVGGERGPDRVAGLVEDAGNLGGVSASNRCGDVASFDLPGLGQRLRVYETSTTVGPIAAVKTLVVPPGPPPDWRTGRRNLRASIATAT